MLCSPEKAHTARSSGLTVVETVIDPMVHILFSAEMTKPGKNDDEQF
jgi:hypothetical protein